jgi:phosphocarrier protein NPr
MERMVTVGSKAGLHARPVSLIVKEAAHFKASMQLVRGEKVADLKGVLGLMMLGAKYGERLLLRAEGPDAAEALEAVAALIERELD